MEEQLTRFVVCGLVRVFHALADEGCAHRFRSVYMEESVIYNLGFCQFFSNIMGCMNLEGHDKGA